MADDLKIIETDYSRVLEEKKKKESRYPGKEYTFKNIPNSENVFVWGAYGNPWGGFGTWCERSNPKLHEHVHKVNKNRRMLPVSLPLMKRYYFNSITVGGGMIFSTQGDLLRKQCDRDKCLCKENTPFVQEQKSKKNGLLLIFSIWKI